MAAGGSGAAAESAGGATCFNQLRRLGESSPPAPAAAPPPWLPAAGRGPARLLRAWKCKPKAFLPVFLTPRRPCCHRPATHNSYHVAPDPLLIDRVLSIPIVAAGLPDGRRLAKMWEYTHLPLDQQLDMGGWHCLLGACLGRTMPPALAMAAQQTMRIRCHSWKHIRHVWAAVRLHPANLNTSTISRRDRLASSSNRPSYRCTAGVRGFEIDVHADPEGGLYSAAAGLRLAGVNGYRNDSELFEPGFKVGPLRFGLQYGWNTVPSGANVDGECWHGTYQRGHFCKPEHNVAACKFGADTPRCLRVLQAGGW